MNHASTLLLILMVEAAIGYPRNWWHPVMAAGAVITTFEQRWNHGAPLQRRLAGVFLLFLLVGLSASLGAVTERLAEGLWGAALVVLIGSTGLAQRSLYDHVSQVAHALSISDLPAARVAVSMIVGRDTVSLDEAGVATAAIESLAESFCDGVVAPAFWFLIFGLPGLFAAKAINTADSMVGHRCDRYNWFGWACARADDFVNWIPARIAGSLICLVARGGWRTMWHDAPHNASPNAGWPEAAMAGGLACSLGGPVSYDGEVAPRGRLGCGPVPSSTDLDRALKIYCIACLLVWVGVGITGLLL